MRGARVSVAFGLLVVSVLVDSYRHCGGVAVTVTRIVVFVCVSFATVFRGVYGDVLVSISGLHYVLMLFGFVDGSVCLGYVVG